MTAIGTIAILVSPFEARLIARWLRTEPPPLLGLLRLNVPTLPNGNRIDLVERLEAVAARKRSTGPFQQVEIRLDRDDAAWFASKVASGLFGGAWRHRLPPLVQLFCRRCSGALKAKVGRKTLRGERLRKEAGRVALDQRHRKRLQARIRSEERLANSFARGGLASAWLLGLDEDLP